MENTTKNIETQLKHDPSTHKSSQEKTGGRRSARNLAQKQRNKNKTYTIQNKEGGRLQTRTAGRAKQTNKTARKDLACPGRGPKLLNCGMMAKVMLAHGLAKC